MSRSPRWRRRLLGVAVGATAALLLAELALRALGLPDTNQLFLATETSERETFVPDAEVFWRLSPKSPDANEQGLRGPWWEATKASNEFRILAVGDSCTYGFGVEWEATWAVRTERLLQAERSGHVVRSALAALPGYSTWQNRRLLERVLDAARPDAVVFYCGAWNDFVPTAGASDLELARQLEGSRLLLLVRTLLQPGLAHYRAMLERGEAPNGRRVPLPDFERLLDEMVQASRARGATVVMIAPSHPASTTERYPGVVAYRDRVLAVARQQAVPVVDLAEVVRRLDPTGAPSVPGSTNACFLDWVHPARNLHEALAHEVAERLAAAAPPRTPLPPRTMASIEVRDRRAVIPAQEFVGAPILRAWLGEHRASVEFVGGELHAAIPDELPPGRHELQIVLAAGARSLGEVMVPHLPMKVAITGNVATFAGGGAVGRLVVLWTADALAEPVQTSFGAFGLAIEAIRRPVAGMHRFDLAAENRHHGYVGPDGTWSITVPRAAAQNAQALVLDPATGRGALTVVVRAP